MHARRLLLCVLFLLSLPLVALAYEPSPTSPYNFSGGWTCFDCEFAQHHRVDDGNYHDPGCGQSGSPYYFCGCSIGYNPGEMLKPPVLRVTGPTTVEVEYWAKNIYCNPPGDGYTQYEPLNTTYKIAILAVDPVTLNTSGTPVHVYAPYWEHGKIIMTGMNPSCTMYRAVYVAEASSSVRYLVSSNVVGGTGASGGKSCLVDLNSCSLPGSAGPGGGMSPGVGKPINVGSANMQYSETLFTIPQPGGNALGFTVSYNSRDTATGPLGTGWTHPFSQSLISQGSARVWRGPSGQRVLYINENHPPTGEIRRPVYPADAMGSTSISPSGSLFRQKSLAGTLTDFDSATGRWTKTTDRWSNGITGTYTGSDLTAITDAMGRVWTLGYVGGKLASITDGDGNQWRFTYDGSGRLEKIFDPLHTGTTPWRDYVYVTVGSASYLAAVRDEAGAVLEGHEYDASGRAISSWTGDTLYAPHPMPGPNARDLVTLAYNSTTQTTVTTKIDSGVTQSTVYTLKAGGGRFLATSIVGSCASCGGTADSTTFTYDDLNRPITKTVGLGAEQVTTSYTYDANGMVKQVIEAVGAPEQRTTTYTYGLASWPGFATTIAEASAAKPGQSRVTTFTWGAGETLLTQSVSGYLKPTDASPTTYTVTTAFDARHRITEVAGPRAGQRRTWTYYPDADSVVNRRGRTQTMAIFTGATASLATTVDDYDAYGNARKATDPNGVETVRTFDGRGRATSAKSVKPAADPAEPPDTLSTTVYDGRDRILSSLRPGGNGAKFVYEDGTNRLLQTIVVDASGLERERQVVTLNTAGRTTSEAAQECSVPANPCTSWVTRHSGSIAYDSSGRLQKKTHADGAEVHYAYDSRGNLLSIRDARHAAPNMIYTYDPLNRAKTVTQKRTLVPGSDVVTQYVYDAHDNVTSITDANGNVTTSAYDDFRRLQTQTSPVSGTTSYSYDAANNVTSTTDANGATTTRTYDFANRPLTSLSSRSGQSDESAAWTYDDATAGHYGRGRVATISDPTGSTAYRYDRRGHMRHEAKTIEATTYTTTYGYDANGNRSLIGYPSGRTVNYTFDFADRPYSASSGATTYVASATYYPFGPRRTTVFGNGTTQELTVDTDYHLDANQLTGPSGTIASYDYVTDASGNIEQLNDLTNAAYNRTFAYDDLHRLITANSGASLWGSGSFSYDAIGNVQSLTLGSRTASFSYSGTTSKLASVTENGTPRTVSYDAAGNEINVGGSAFTYSPRNTLAEGDGLTYAYDGRNVRTITNYPPSLLDSVSVTPSTLYPNQSGSGTVTLGSPAPAGGLTVNLASSNASVLVPASVTFAAGETQATFTVTLATGAAAGSATITASYGTASVTTTLTVAAAPSLTSVTLSPSTVTGGTSSTVTVTLDAAAPAGGAPVQLASDSASASVPVSVTVAAGATSATATVTTSVVATATTVTITGTYGNTATATLQLQPLALVSVVITPASITGGQPASGTVTLNGAAPSGGVTIALASSNAAASVPASVSVASGAISANFTVTTTPQAAPVTVTITATYNSASVTDTLDVTPCTTGLAAPPTIPAGETIWVDDSLPTGAFLQNGYYGPVHWDTSQHASGTQALVNNIVGPLHYESYITGLTEPMQIGERAVAYFLINECAIPREIQLVWDTSKGTHRLFWGESLMGGEHDGVNMGPVPAAGEWIRVEVPSHWLLEQSTVSRIRILHHGGQVWFDRFGKTGTACTPAVAPPPSLPAGDTVFADDTLPAGASLQNGYYGPVHWDTTQNASGSQSLVNYWYGARHYESYLRDLNQPIHVGETVFAYFMINECTPAPREIQIVWDTNKGSQRVFWGESLMGGEHDGINMGPVPAAGQWIRVQVPSTWMLEQSTLSRIRLLHHGGQVFFDRFGKTGTACLTATAPPPVIPAGDTVWVDDGLPGAAFLQNGYYGPARWDTSQKASGSQALVHYWYGARHYESYIRDLNEPLQFGEKVVAYFMINECTPAPREIQLVWDTTTKGARHVYWGEALMGGENGAIYMGPVPAAGQWVRVEVPVTPILEQTNVWRIRMLHHGGQVWFDRFGKTGTACTPAASAPPTIPAGETVWLDDPLPSGVTLHNDTGYGVLHADTSQAASGTTSLVNTWLGEGRYSTRIEGMTQETHFGESGTVWVRVNECAPPREIWLRWSSADDSSRVAYWGEALIHSESSGVYMGPIPAGGSWVRLEVPFSSIGFEQRTIKRITVAHYGGQVWFDRFGKTGTPCIPAAAAQPSVPSSDTILIDDTLPSGASMSLGFYGPLLWDTTQSASGTRSLRHPRHLPNQWHETYIDNFSMPIDTGDSAVVYLRVNECAIPREIRMIFFTSTKGHKHVYWGEQLLGSENTAVNMGPVPAAGVWHRIEIPFATMGLEPSTLTRLELSHAEGQVWFDRIGKTASVAPAILTGFTASHASPQPSGSAITWTATATGSVMPLQYRFEREDNGTWSEVQAYGTSNTYTWTPGSGDVGTHAVRVSVRNAGSTAAFDDTDTLTMTITSGGASLAPQPQSQPPSMFAKLRDWFTSERRVPVSLGISFNPLAGVESTASKRYSLYTPELHLMAQTAITSATAPPIEYEFIWFGGVPVAQVDVATNTTHWTFTDHLGTPVIQTDAAGAVDWRVEYEPYGEVFAVRTGAARHQPLRFPGQEYDAAAPERAYNVFRWYRDAWGRYAQADPIGLEGGLNLYGYVRQSPVMRTDPLGLKTCLIFTRDTFLGIPFTSHTALWSDGQCKPGSGCNASGPSEPFIYDPAGSFMAVERGSGAILTGEFGSIDDFMKYHRDSGSKVEMYCFDTTCCEEQQIRDRAEQIGDPRGFSCSRSVTACVAGIGPFSDLMQTSIPGSCRSQILNERRTRPDHSDADPSCPACNSHRP
ncbi:MAG TPA: RHS repeat-associated core domain-containing protein [Thermoanaerobaculia bacterium]